MAIMTNLEFVKRAKEIATNYKTLYVMGCFGSPLNSTNKLRYCNNHSYNRQASRTKKIRNASSDTFGFDCVCLIKGILWGWNGDKNKTYGGASYNKNGIPDVTADSMLKNYCTNISTNFKNIEVGELVWMPGHIGIYIGNGLAIECTPIWADKVQITAVGNIGKKSGYNTRTWTKHGKSKFISYGNSSSINNSSSSLTYQSYDNVKKKWLPNVKVGTANYIGNFGNAIGGVYIDNLEYRVHDKVKGKWLPWVKGRLDFAGNLGNAVDGLQVKEATYRVHIKGGKWLDWVSKVDDTNSGYGGIYGREIDAIQIK